MRKTIALILCLCLIADQARAAFPAPASRVSAAARLSPSVFSSQALLLQVTMARTSMLSHTSSAAVRRAAARSRIDQPEGRDDALWRRVDELRLLESTYSPNNAVDVMIELTKAIWTEPLNIGETALQIFGHLAARDDQFRYALPFIEEQFAWAHPNLNRGTPFTRVKKSQQGFTTLEFLGVMTGLAVLAAVGVVVYMAVSFTDLQALASGASMTSPATRAFASIFIIASVFISVGERVSRQWKAWKTPLPVSPENDGYILPYATILESAFRNYDRVDRLAPETLTPEDILPILHDEGLQLADLSEIMTDRGRSIAIFRESLGTAFFRKSGDVRIPIGMVQFPLVQAKHFGDQIRDPGFTDWYLQRVLGHLIADSPRHRYVTSLGYENGHIFLAGVEARDFQKLFSEALVKAEFDWLNSPEHFREKTKRGTSALDNLRSLKFYFSHTVATTRLIAATLPTLDSEFVLKSEEEREQMTSEERLAYKQAWIHNRQTMMEQYRYKIRRRGKTAGPVDQPTDESTRLASESLAVATLDYLVAAADLGEKASSSLQKEIARVATPSSFPAFSVVIDDSVMNVLKAPMAAVYANASVRSTSSDVINALFDGFLKATPSLNFQSGHLPRRGILTAVLKEDLSNLRALSRKYRRYSPDPSPAEKKAFVKEFRSLYENYHAYFLLAAVYGPRNPRSDEIYNAVLIDQVLEAYEQGLFPELKSRILTLQERLEKSNNPEKKKLAEKLFRASSLLQWEAFVYARYSGDEIGVAIPRGKEAFETGLLELTRFGAFLRKHGTDGKDTVLHSIQQMVLNVALDHSPLPLSQIFDIVKSKIPSIDGRDFDVIAKIVTADHEKRRLPVHETVASGRRLLLASFGDEYFIRRSMLLYEHWMSVDKSQFPLVHRPAKAVLGATAIVNFAHTYPGDVEKIFRHNETLAGTHKLTLFRDEVVYDVMIPIVAAIVENEWFKKWVIDFLDRWWMKMLPVYSHPPPTVRHGQDAAA